MTDSSETLTHTSICKTALLVSALAAFNAGEALAQQASNFQDSCRNIQYEERNGVAGISAMCQKKNGDMVNSFVELRGISNEDGDLVHPGNGDFANFNQSCGKMEVVPGGASRIMLVGDCKRRDGSWVGTSTQLWDLVNIDGVLQYTWAPKQAAPKPAAPKPVATAPSSSSSPFPDGYFRLTSQFREGYGECLESNSAGNGPIHMDSCQNVSGQLWKAKAAGNGFYTLTSMFREEHNECLESNAKGNARSHMDSCQNVSGQLWKAIPEGGGYFRLTSMFREGHGECLESNQPNNGGSHMDNCQNVSGQYWKVMPANNAPLPSDVSTTVIERELEETGVASLTINFEYDSSDLTPEARRLLSKLADAISAPSLRGSRFEVQGHTDAAGDRAYNQTLSEHRVISVAAELSDIHGIDLSRLDPVGYGETRLLDPARPRAGINRRVEVHRIGN